jgi:hypothetical protein
MAGQDEPSSNYLLRTWFDYLLRTKTCWAVTLGLTTLTATSALSRETLSKGTLETPETQAQERLKRLMVMI